MASKQHEVENKIFKYYLWLHERTDMWEVWKMCKTFILKAIKYLNKLKGI